MPREIWFCQLYTKLNYIYRIAPSYRLKSEGIRRLGGNVQPSRLRECCTGLHTGGVGRYSRPWVPPPSSCYMASREYLSDKTQPNMTPTVRALLIIKSCWLHKIVHYQPVLTMELTHTALVALSCMSTPSVQSETNDITMHRPGQ